MEYQIKSRKLKTTVTFSRPGYNYIYIDLNGYSGTLGYQICKGGSLYGDTVEYHGNDEKQFERICKRWWKQYLRRVSVYNWF